MNNKLDYFGCENNYNCNECELNNDNITNKFNFVCCKYCFNNLFCCDECLYDKEEVTWNY